jgi:hypothetical protein
LSDSRLTNKTQNLIKHNYRSFYDIQLRNRLFVSPLIGPIIFPEVHNNGKVKGKGHPITGHESPEGKIYAFFNLDER